MYVWWISVLSLLEGLLDGLRVRDLALVAAGLVGLLGLLVWQSYRQGRRRVHDSAAPASNLRATLRSERRSSLSTLVSLACGISNADVQSRQEGLATGSHSAKLEFDLRLLVEHGTRRLASQAESKGLRFTTAVAANVPQRVRGDAAGMAVAFTNLLDNAVKFTSEGAVRLEVAVTRDARRPPNLRFVVYDTGAGMDAETLGRVLEPRGPADGHGLPVTVQLVSRMGGTMGAESEPRGGSSFWFSVPVELLVCTGPASPQRHPPPDAHSACTRGPLLPRASRAGQRVLIVENDGCAQVAALWGVRALGYYGEVVSDGCSGVEAFQHTPFDLVLLDSTSADFVETVERIRRLETGCIPVVLMHPRGAGQPPARIEGVEGELAKPLCLVELAGTLEQWLGAAGPAHTSEASSDRLSLPV